MCRAWACTSMMVRAHSDHPKLNMFFLPFAPFHHRVLGFRDRFQLRCDLSLLNQRPAESTSVANLSLSTNSDKTKKISRETSLLRATTHATPVPPFPGRTSRVTITLASLARRISRPALDALSHGAPSSPRGICNSGTHPNRHLRGMASWAPALFGDTLVAEGGSEVKTEDALKDKIVGVYFSAHWCVPNPPGLRGVARACRHPRIVSTSLGTRAAPEHIVSDRLTTALAPRFVPAGALRAASSPRSSARSTRSSSPEVRTSRSSSRPPTGTRRRSRSTTASNPGSRCHSPIAI